MTLPFPRRIPLVVALFTGVCLAGVLLAEGNNLFPCLVVFSTVLVTALGFNRTGGLSSPVGAYLFFTVLFTGLLGTAVKAATNEPLLNNVPNADQTLLVYLVGTCAMVAAALLSQRVRPSKPFLAGRLTQQNTSRGVIGCLVAGIGLPYVLYMFMPSIASISRQLNLTLPLAVLIGVYQKTKQTGGRSSFSWPVFIAWAYTTWTGLLSYSKEQMFSASLAWVVAAAAARLRVSLLQLIVLVPTGALAVLILVPYSTYGRNFRDATVANPDIAYNMLRHPLELRDRVNAALEMQEDIYHWFNKPRGIFDRLTLVPVDSALLRRTDQAGTIGLENLYVYVQNMLPHFILPNKPDVHTGNNYAHEIGMLAPEDFTTGISFSPYADAYHQAGWIGVLLIMPLVQFFMFFMLNLVTGSVDDSPWALFFIVSFGHIAAEGLMLVPMYVASFGIEAVIATAFLMIYVTPVIGSLIAGPGKAAMTQTFIPQSLPRREPISG